MSPVRLKARRPDISAGIGLALTSKRTLVMGVLNVTPDSFSDGGKFFNKNDAVAHAIRMVREGADIIDIGGESTRPGAREVDAKEEAARVVPVIERLREKVDVPISIDTRKSLVAEAALSAGASIINDVSGLKNDAYIACVASRYNATLIVMHMKGTPKDMQNSPRYHSLIKEIMAGLKESINVARRAKVNDNKLIIDPGIGFGKTVKHNLLILKNLEKFKAMGYPICVGTSRKSFIGKILNIEDPAARLVGTVASSVLAIIKGASIIRAHDVKEMVEAARMADSILNAKAKSNAGC